MHPFAYHRPASLAEARRLLADIDEARLLAGGMTLLPTMKMRLAAPAALIDLAAVDELRGIRAGDDEIRIGALSTHAQVAASPDVRASLPALAQLAARIGDPQVRNLGTLGGSLANCDPAADYPAAALALGATIVTDRREIAADDFFVGMFETALQADEVITAVRFPLPSHAAYAKFPNPASRYAIVGVMVAATRAGVRVAVTGAAASVYREAAMEAALSRSFAADALQGIDVDSRNFNSDLHASAGYRGHLVGVMARRATLAALAAAGAR